MCVLTKKLWRVRVTILAVEKQEALQHFPTLSHKRHDFRKNKVLNIKSVFWFSLQLLSETFLILRRHKGVTIINVYRSPCKVSAILVRF
jgi:hypothetical protein